MTNEQMTDLLTALLDCGYLDLRILNECEYNMIDLIEEVDSMGYEKIDINNLCFAMFQLGLRDMQESISERISDLENEEELGEFEKGELEALKELEPFDDFESFHNYIDTHIYLSQYANHKEEMYQNYCEKELNHFEKMTGFSIGF